MNKPDHDREKLLAEAFHGEWTEGSAAGFARAAAAQARRRHTVRRTLLASTAMAAAALLLTWLNRPTDRHSGIPTASSPAPAPAYEIISDDELLLQLRDQPLLVVRRENGTREFVLLEN
jgi:hypothetical protein